MSSSGASEAYKSFGRGTPAGNALFRIYKKKDMDSTLDPELLKNLQKMRKEKEEAEKLQQKPKAVPKSKTHVAVPKARFRPSDEQIAEYRLNSIQHKKSADAIQTMTQKENQYNKMPPPVPSRPAITEKEKDRLAQIMQYGQELKQRPLVQLQQEMKAKQKTPYDLLEERFNEISREIAERKEFLKDLRNQRENGVPQGQARLGGKTALDQKEYETRLMCEISDRIAELKHLDSEMKKQCPIPPPSSHSVTSY